MPKIFIEGHDGLLQNIPFLSPTPPRTQRNLFVRLISFVNASLTLQNTPCHSICSGEKDKYSRAGKKNAFKHLLEAIAQSPVLHLTDINKPFVLNRITCLCLLRYHSPTTALNILNLYSDNILIVNILLRITTFTYVAFIL